jgi:hypothetical protein
LTSRSARISPSARFVKPSDNLSDENTCQASALTALVL